MFDYVMVMFCIDNLVDEIVDLYDLVIDVVECFSLFVDLKDIEIVVLKLDYVMIKGDIILL